MTAADSATQPLAGSAAFRDLGGLPGAGGRCLAHGRLFRADALSDVGHDQRAFLGALGLRLVCDLRGSAERDREPCLAWLEPAPRRLHLDVSSGLAVATAGSVALLRRGPDPAAAAAMMRTTYAQLPHAAAPLLGQLFEAMADGHWPVLVHCTAGKDRTGFAIAMILSALGTPRELIFDDYLRGSGRDPLLHDQPSGRLLEAIVGRRLEPDEAVLVHGVHREYLAASFATIERDWGSVAEYLARAAGLDAARSRAMLRHFLT